MSWWRWTIQWWWRTSTIKGGCAPVSCTCWHTNWSCGAALSPGTYHCGGTCYHGGDALPPAPRTHGAVGLAPEWLILSAVGLSQRVISTIQSALASSTRSLCDCKWRVFEGWCHRNGHIPFQWPVGVILSFLQDLRDKRKALSTIKVYLAAITACHVGFGKQTASQHPLVCRFMKGA